ncbi:MAG: hypothetical protein ACD_7C00074G0008 [uncultured bacterium]|nr:MAG: hypothetical protein ACD_7C00074G0008 [uncultured bacterium]
MINSTILLLEFVDLPACNASKALRAGKRFACLALACQDG